MSQVTCEHMNTTAAPKYGGDYTDSGKLTLHIEGITQSLGSILIYNLGLHLPKRIISLRLCGLCQKDT